MKKMCFLAVLLAIICLSLSLTACSGGKTASIGQIFDLTYVEDAMPMISKYELVETFNQYDYELELVKSNKTKELLYFVGTSKDTKSNATDEKQLILVYDLINNKIVKEIEYPPLTTEKDENGEVISTTTLSYTISFASYTSQVRYEDDYLPSTEDSFFTVKLTKEISDKNGNSKKDTSVTLYDTNGETLQTTSKDTFVRKMSDNLFIFDKTFYKETDGKLTKVSEIPNYNNIFSFNYYINGHFYSLKTVGAIHVYDEAMNLVYDWSYNESDAEVKYFVLNNGDILVQIITKQPEYSDEYDYIHNGNKYTIKQMILNPTKKSEKEIDAEFVVSQITSISQASMDDGSLKVSLKGYHSTVENVASVIFIEDQRINEAETVTVSMNNNATIKNIFAPIDVNTKQQTFFTMGNGYFFVSVNDQSYVFDSTGTQIATYSGNLDRYYKFLIDVEDGIIFDYKLNKLYECDEHTYITKVADEYVILSTQNMGDTTYYYFDGTTEPKELFTFSTQSIDLNAIKLTVYAYNEDYYIKGTMDKSDPSDVKVSYTYYALDGSYLCTSTTESSFMTVASCDSAILLIDNDGIFHRFFADNN